MALIPIRVNRASKPPAGTPLRTDGHWSVDGIAGHWGMLEAAGSIAVDGSPWRRNATLSATMPPLWKGGSLLFNGDASTEYSRAYLPNADYLGGAAGATVVAGITASAGQASSSGLVMFLDNGTTNITTRILLNITTGRAVNIRSRSADETQAQATTANGIVPVGVPVVVASAFDLARGRQRAYVGNREVVNAAASYARATFTARSTIGGGIGCLPNLGSYSFGGSIHFVALYRRALGAEQVAALAANPWQIYEPETVWIDVPSGGGAARSLIAALTGESVTGTISAIITRALSGDVTATSITGAITASMARDLLASLQGQSTTGDVAATLQRLLLASLGGASTTGDVAATTARALLADLQAESTTPDIAATLAALVALIANISGTTTTPAVAATMARALAANLAGQSTTGAIAVEFAGMLLLVASIAGTSTTGALTATTGRELRAAIATASTTGQVDGQLLRQIAATIAGTSLTGSIAAELVNLVSLAASVVGVSLTPAVAATLSRDLAAEVAAGSTTGAASTTVARALTAAVEAGSLTPDNLVLILTGLGILHDTTIISRTPIRGISSRTVRRTIHSA